VAGLSRSQVSNWASQAWSRLPVHGRAPAKWLIELVLLDVAVAGNSLWLLRAAAVVLLGVLPGQLLLRALRIPAMSVGRYIAYLPCASLAVLIFTTLAVDLVGPVLGVHEPLRRWPLLVGLNLTLPVLAMLGSRASASCDLHVFELIGNVRWIWPLLLPLVSIAAAARLDNGDGNLLAIIVVVAVGVMIPVGTAFANRLEGQQLHFLLYSSGLALMLLTSMRSAYVIGFDINAEYFDMHQTVLSGIWHFGHLNPYEAMLSVTVLPASLHGLIGGQDALIFKLGYPALFAFFPVAVFELGTRFLSRRAAFVAAALVISQSYFFQQQPEIARQELALLIFAGVIGALLDISLRRGAQIGLVCVLGVSLVVCHYSTTYVTILLCLMAAVLAVVLSWGRTTPIPVLPWLVAGLVMAAAAAIWYLPATHSTSNVTSAAQAIRQNGIQLLPGRRKGENIITAYFNGLRESPPSPAQYQSSIAAYYRGHSRFIVPLAAAKNPAYDLQAAPPLSVPDHAPAIASGLNAAELLVQQMIDAFAVIGALVFAFRRRGNPLTRMIGAIGLTSFFILAASRLSGSLATDYNSSRLFVQCLFVLALLEAALIEMVVTRLKSRTWVGPLLFGGFSLMLLVAFVGNSGLAVPVVGGNPSLILSNKGEDYSALYPSSQERRAVQWLAASVPSQRLIYADYYGQLRLDQFTGLRNAVFIDITPLTIDRHAWVFASTTNVVRHRSWGSSSSGIVDLVFPASFLDRYFDVVYSTGSTEVFHR
jgi:uncharacterized membrane protein